MTAETSFNDDFFEMIDTADNIYALTGAGISTLSGIPDFRSNDGLYSNTFEGYAPETLLDVGFFVEHPDIFYRYAAENLYAFLDRKPNIVHTMLAKMQKKGVLNRVYTQNIDTLHTQAGTPDAGELHGALDRHYCMECGKTFPTGEIYPVARRGEVPRCGVCGGLVKPSVIFFGEFLDASLLNGAFDDMTRCSVLLVMGTSLTVPPAAYLPQEAYRSGARIVIVNKQHTMMDRFAAYRFEDLKAFSETLDSWLDKKD